MITLMGPEGCSEYYAALQVRDVIAAQWPDVVDAEESEAHIIISASAKLSGYKVQDIDIVLVGAFSGSKTFRPTRNLRDSSGRSLSAKPVNIDNFVVAIEVKNHSEKGINIRGDQISVSYTSGHKKTWKSASDQNISQVHALKEYFADQQSTVFVRGCMIFAGVSSIAIPVALPAKFNCAQLFTAISSGPCLRSNKGAGVLRSFDPEIAGRILGAPLFREIKASGLNRKQMDRIVHSSPVVRRLLEQAGQKMTIIRGHGGSGKTIALLQAAWQCYKKDGSQTLLLTYNLALASDIRRLMALLGVPSISSEGGLRVQTVMSFMFGWFNRLGLSSDEGFTSDISSDFNMERYNNLCIEALELIDSGALSDDDILNVKDSFPDSFEFDHIFVDEGQDWPIEEIRLVKALYPVKRLTVADGVDQLVRNTRADWLGKTDRDDVHFEQFDSCLRMKRNLALFANEIASQSDIGWEFKPNSDAAGGRLLLLEKEYTASNGLHTALVDSLEKSGNAAIDMLFCVPPARVGKVEGVRASDMAQSLSALGCEVWDGASSIARKDFPRSAENFRIVQYESCRGLEGWVVVLEAFDEFLQLKYDEKMAVGLTSDEEESYVDLEQLAIRYAIRWGLIPLSRPIDTLVIHLSDLNSRFSKLIIAATKDFDFVEKI